MSKMGTASDMIRGLYFRPRENLGLPKEMPAGGTNTHKHGIRLRQIRSDNAPPERSFRLLI